MEKPTDEQLADAIIESAREGESEAEFEERIADLHRLTDEELAAMGAFPHGQQPSEPDRDAPSGDPPSFQPVPVKSRHDGWTAERQRAFIAALAETGCVSEACAEVGITPRSAYRLREHPRAAAFRDAWDHANSMATARLTALAFERAVHGSVERIYRGGELVEERHKTSDRLLMWLIAHLDPAAFGWLSRAPKDSPDFSFYTLQNARKEMPKLLRKLGDVDPDTCATEEVKGSDLDPYEIDQPAA
jgi:hypothetical protein